MAGYLLQHQLESRNTARILASSIILNYSYCIPNVPRLRWRIYLEFVADVVYRRSTNLACGGAKSFSHPLYSQYGFIHIQSDYCFEHFGGFDIAPPRGFDMQYFIKTIYLENLRI